MRGRCRSAASASGINYLHPDLSANIYRNEDDCNTDGVDNDGNGYADDCHGIDTFNNDTGIIVDGWQLNVTTETPIDFVGTAGVVTIASGATTQTFNILINGDTRVEPTETFYVNLASPSDAILTDNRGDGTILNDDSSVFTDTTLSAGVTFIKAVHIEELRARINALRTNRGLGSYPWTDSPLVAGSTMVRVAHVMEMRTALAEAFQAAGISPTFSQALIVAGSTIITASQIAELRSAVVSLESQ